MSQMALWDTLQIDRPGPTFGRDNQYVLETILGYSEERIADLVVAGVLQ